MVFLDFRFSAACLRLYRLRQAMALSGIAHVMSCRSLIFDSFIRLNSWEVDEAWNRLLYPACNLA